MIIKNADLWDNREFHEQLAYREDLRDVELEGSRKRPEFAEFMKDVFCGLYKYDPQTRDEPEDSTAWMDQMYDEITRLPEWKTLRERTKLDAEVSAAATAEFCGQFLADLPDEQDKPEDGDQDNAQQPGGPMPAQPGNNPTRRQQIDPSAVRNAARKACEQASQKADETKRMMSAFGQGNQGGQQHMASPNAKKQLAEKLVNNEHLQKIAELAGKMQRTALDKQRVKSRHGVDEVADIMIGDDLSRLVPAEMMKLAHPSLKLLFKKNYLEKQLMQYRIRGNEKQARGPLIVCIDESGTMKGQRDVWAKAAAMALLTIAQKQKRKYMMIHFDQNVQRVDRFEKKADPLEIIDAISHFTSGGTEFEEPLNQAVQAIAGEQFYKSADIVFITDGDAAVSEKFVETFNMAKKLANFEVISVLIGPGTKQTCELFSDRIIKMHNVNDDREAQEVMFSI